MIGKPLAKRRVDLPGLILCAGLTAAVALAGLTAPAAAQTPSPFAGFKHDASQPIEVAADSLEVRNAENKAIFRGGVDVQQGVVRMKADQLEITYRRGGEARPNAQDGAIDRLKANGNVVMSNGKESAQADAADYDVEAGAIILSGNVILLQGENAIAGERLRIDLASGTAQMTGQQPAPTASDAGAGGGGGSRVRVQLNPSEQN